MVSKEPDVVSAISPYAKLIEYLNDWAYTIAPTGQCDKEKEKELKIQYNTLQEVMNVIFEWDNRKKFNYPKKARQKYVDRIDRQHLLSDIQNLKESPWFKEGSQNEQFVRKDAVAMVEDFIKAEERC